MTKQSSFLPFDELDYAILQQLNKNARASAVDIARVVNANERTVRKRIDRMVELGAVRLTAIVDPHFFGYGISVDIFLEIDADQEASILGHLQSIPSITYLAYGHGTTDISIEGRFKDSEEMRHFLRHVLPGIPGVSVKGYALVPGILRNIDEWMPPPEDFGITTKDSD
ncbi:Lrp/AsnC family transcriptional regulator [Ornatilinea apprima]|uniref:Lrp/AsnC family transcriptional regulator n=1 Tax=Ornatilinea apprima TaxID=1134406 RepID=UPI0009465876|nr:AsnC family transcriptional regulator [Ornatilinea apprima]